MHSPDESPRPNSTEDRKDAHLRICLEEAIAGLDVTTGFERVRFEHDALPELALSEVDTSVELFGKRLAAPLMIGAMTGGTERAGRINRILAEAAETCGIAMALGSQRKMIEQPAVRATFKVRDVAPNVLLMGNVGAVQLNYGVGLDQVRFLIEEVGADLFAFHLNPLQEAVQPEGDTDFRGLVGKLEALVPRLPVPVILKEVGAGFSKKTLRRVVSLPIAGIETAGVGGTSWSKIESFRTDSWVQQMTGRRLATWGVPTMQSLQAAVSIFHGTGKAIFCSGGIRTGLEVAKAVALGADLVCSALPFLKAASEGGLEATILTIRQMMAELRTVLFCTGSRTLAELRQAELVPVEDMGFRGTRET